MILDEIKRLAEEAGVEPRIEKQSWKKIRVWLHYKKYDHVFFVDEDTKEDPTWLIIAEKAIAYLLSR